MLTVDFLSGGTADDRLYPIDANRMQIDEANGIVTYRARYVAIPIATFTGGTGTTPLVFTFNANATPDGGIRQLIQHVAFQNVSDNPVPGQRVVRFVISDGDGGTSTPQTGIVNVAAVNDPLAITFPSSPFAYTVGGPQLVFDAAATATDLDTTKFFDAGGGFGAAMSASIADADARHRHDWHSPSRHRTGPDRR